MSPSRGRNLMFVACVLSARVALAANQARPDATREFTKAVPMSAGQLLQIDHSQGNVDVAGTTGRDAQIRAVIRVSGYSVRIAQEFADRIAIQVSSSPTTTTVHTQYPRTDNSRGWLDTLLGRTSTSFAVDYTILVPQGVLLSVRNRFGDVRVAGITAKTTVANSNGRIYAKDLAPGTRLENSFGAVEVSHTQGDLTISNSNGAVTLVDAGGPVTITDRFGAVAVRNVGGELSITNSNGPVDVLNASGAASVRSSFDRVRLEDIAGEVTVDNSNGGIDAHLLRGGGQLTTSFGAITVIDAGKRLSLTGSNSRISVTKVNGPLYAKTNFGPIEIRDVTGPVDAQNTNGNVTISNIRGAVQARTSFGSLSLDNVAGGLTAENSNGAVRALTINGAAVVRTTFGLVSLKDVTGEVQIDNQNGSIEALLAAGRSCANVRATTSFGAIRIGVPESFGYTVSLRTSFGRITSDLPISTVGALTSNSISGTIGRGGCAMNLASSNGDIAVNKIASTRP